MLRIGWLISAFIISSQAFASVTSELAPVTGEYKLVSGQGCSSGRVDLEGDEAQLVLVLPDQKLMSFINKGVQLISASGPDQCRDEANTVLQKDNGVIRLQEVVKQICPQSSQTTTTALRFTANKMAMEIIHKSSDPKKREFHRSCAWVKAK